MDLLVFDPNLLTSGFVVERLKNAGFSVETTTQLHDIKARLLNNPTLILLLHIDAPCRNESAALIRFVREHYPNAGIVVMSRPCTAHDRTLGLEMGADDCLDDSVDMRELVARLRRLAERLNILLPRSDDGIRFGGFHLNREARSLTWLLTGERVPLTNRDYELLICLLEAGNRAVGRQDLSVLICGRPWQVEDRSIDVSVSNLRKKLRRYNTSDILIRSIRGLGYCLIMRHE